MSQTSFEIHGVSLPVFDHAYNTTARNERAVEIPYAMWWLSKHGNGRGLEVGNVLSHYFPEMVDAMETDVVDKYEIADHVLNADVFDICGPYDYIYAISTLEHVRWDQPEERDLDGAARAVTHLHEQLRLGGKMLITVPFGSNPGLDYAILSGDWGPGWLERQAVMMLGGGLWYETPAGHWLRKGGEWHQAETIWWERYGKSTAWAECVWIGEFTR